jgi:uracil-DNA glycosylase family 4
VQKRPNSNCEDCPLKDTDWVPTQIVDEPDLPVFFIGQNPGGTEMLTHVPFTGRSGKTAYRLLAEAGLNKRKLNIGNLIACPTPEDRAPTLQEVECCAPGLQAEIEALQPELIIAWGKPSLKALVGRVDIQKVRGNFFLLLPRWQYACQVLVALHPSFVQRQRQWISDSVEDLKKIQGFFLPSSIQVEDKPEFIYDPSPEQLTEYLTSSDDVTAFDLETTGLNPRLNKILGVSFCNRPDKTVALYYREPHDARRSVVNWFLSHPQFKKATQNGSFDCAFEHTDGVEVKGLVYDTRLGEHLLASDLPTNLSYLREKYTKHEAYKPSQREMSQIGSMTMQKVLEFNCWDAHVTYDIMKEQLKQLTPGNLKVLDEIYMPLVFTLNYMERTGVKVDVNCLAAIYADLIPKAQRFDQEFFAPLGLNPNSPVQLTKYFGTKDCREESLLDHIKRGHEHADLMQARLDYISLTKGASTFLKGIFQRLEDGRIHTSYHPEGTGTGRISSSAPNLQNIPPRFRIIYTADDPEHVLIESDYSQLELLVAALLGGETGLLEEVARGIKPHHVLGEIIFGRKWDELTRAEQNKEKAVLFGTLGGRTARSIAIEFGCSTYEAEHWQTLCVSKYPGLLRYKRNVEKEFYETGKITTAFGTTRQIDSVTQAYNNPFQGSASFITLTTLNELYKKGFDLRLTVHDSIVLQAEKKHAKEVIREMCKIVQRPISQLQDYRFPAKYKFGPNWYEQEELSDDEVQGVRRKKRV